MQPNFEFFAWYNLKVEYCVRFFLITVLSLLILVFGFKISRSLLAASQFHAGVGRAFVSGLTAALLIGQMTKFILITASNVREYLSLKIMAECVPVEDVTCLYDAFQFNDAVYISPEYGSEGEFLFTLMVRAFQKIRQ